MKLYRLLERIDYTVVSGSIYEDISTIEHNSRKVIAGSVFVCITGSRFDGHSYADEAVKQGATVIVAERPVDVSGPVTLILVKDTRVAIAYMAAAYYEYPAEKLVTIGITGTKGKTTTSYMIREILEYAGIQTGLIGTIEVLNGKESIQAGNTTPDALLIHKYLHQMVENGLIVVVMEVSSQGLKLHRTDGILFDYGIFTNISPDHIGPGEHTSFEEYLACKSLLMRQCRIGIVNRDVPELPQILKGHTCRVKTFGMTREANLYGYGLSLVQRPAQLGIQFYIGGMTSAAMELWMPGAFNIYNALAAILIGLEFHITENVLKEALYHVKVKGRLELVPVSSDYTVMIDYAHNAVSMESVLRTLKTYDPVRIVCLFGCGGNRAKIRRYEMARAAAKYADSIIVTSDNPRNESKEDIIADITSTLDEVGAKYIAITDRVEAIRYAIANARKGDIILLAGKGHETYQEIKGVHYPMDERSVIYEIKNQYLRKNDRKGSIWKHY